MMKRTYHRAAASGALLLPLFSSAVMANPAILPPPSGPLQDPGTVPAPVREPQTPPVSNPGPTAPAANSGQTTPPAAPQPAPPATPPVAEQPPYVAPTPEPSALDAEALNFLDKVAAKYQQLNGLSLIYKATDTRGKDSDVTSGNFAFKRPNLARLEGRLDKGDFGLYVDTQKFIVLAPNKEYRKMAPPPAGSIPRVMGAMPSAAAVFLQVLVDGANPARMQGGGNWSSVKLLPVEAGTHLQGVTLEAVPNPQLKSLVFTLYFDRTDLLLRRGIARASGDQGTFSNETTFTKILVNPSFKPGAFSFVPKPGMKEASAKAPESRTYWKKSLKVGGQPIPLTGKDLTGKARPLSAYKGKVLLVDFWATWCGPCIQELPEIKKTYQKYHSKGFEILGVSLDEDKTELQAFIKANKVTWPQLFDGKNFNGANPKAYELQGIPFTLLIGKDGKIKAINPRGAALEKAVSAALKG